MADWDSYGREGGLYRRLRDACAADWSAYTWHPFVRRLSNGTLPLAGFQHYLVQDYRFLIHFARAKALAVVKGESLEAMRSKAVAVLAIRSELSNMKVNHGAVPAPRPSGISTALSRVRVCRPP